MKLVVTGGGGFVGSHVVERYAKKGSPHCPPPARPGAPPPYERRHPRRQLGHALPAPHEEAGGRSVKSPGTRKANKLIS